MAASVNYSSGPVARSAVMTLGDTSRTGPAAYQVLVPAANIASGMFIERVRVMPLATVTATVMRFWAYRAAGAVWRLLFEMAIPAATISASGAVIPSTGETVSYPTIFPMLIEAGEEVRVSMNDAQTGVQASVEGGAF